MSEIKPASDAVIDDLWVNVLAVVQHEHPKHEDIYCLNLLAYMGERMGPVLERLRAVEAERDAARAELQRMQAESTPLDDEPVEVGARVRDSERDVWTRGADGSWHYDGAEPRPWSELVADWGPLYPVLDGGENQ